ncbi:MAG: transposase [Flavobacteriales bacterium Tduv]
MSYFHSLDIKDHIQKKIYRNPPLSTISILFNKLMSKPRWIVERTFGFIKPWFGSGKALYKGLVRVHAQYLMEDIAYNLYRSFGIIMSYSQ